MTAPRGHALRRLKAERDGWNWTVKIQCRCGIWRQAGSFSAYPGQSGAFLVAWERFCAHLPPGEGLQAPAPEVSPVLAEMAQELARERGRLSEQIAALTARDMELEKAITALDRADNG